MTDSKEIDLKVEADPPSQMMARMNAVKAAGALKRKSTLMNTSGRPANERKLVDHKVSKHTEKSWKATFYILINAVFTQKWMDVAAEYVQTDVKDALYDEQVQLALVSSLVLTMVFPLLYEFTIDWYEFATIGFIGRNTEYYLGVNIFAPEYQGIWYDISMAGYNWGTACLLCAVVTCLVQLVVLNQLDEEHSISYTLALGPAAKKFAFRMLVLGLVLPLVGPYSLRIHATIQTAPGFLMDLGSGIIVAYVIFTIYRS
jgi:hypothetical protein